MRAKKSLPQRSLVQRAVSVRKKKPQARLRSHPHLYEINLWVWLEELSSHLEKRITLSTIPETEWDRLQELGFDMVYLMGVWTRSPLGRLLARTDPQLFPSYDLALPGWEIDDIVGSPYSVQAYLPDPHLGTLAGLKAVRKKLNARGMALIVDFVTNHTGLDHRWIASNPDYYVQGSIADFRLNPSAFFLSAGDDGQTRFIARGRDPYFPPWSDTAQLNYFNPALCHAMVETLKAIARSADGVRCDMAHLVLNDVFQHTWEPLLGSWSAPREEFWKTATEAVRPLLWIGEAYSNTEFALQNSGFDFTYDKPLYDHLRDGNTHQVFAHLKAAFSFQSKAVRFLENHDEERSYKVFGPGRMSAVAALLATLPGLRFYYQGQLEGKTVKLPVQLARVQGEPPHPGVKHIYEKLLALADARVYHSQEWKLLEVQTAGDETFQSLIAYQWSHLTEKDPNAEEPRLVVVNPGNHSAQGRVTVELSLGESLHWEFSDELNGQSYIREAAELEINGLYVCLDGGQAHIFRLRPEIVPGRETQVKARALP